MSYIRNEMNPNDHHSRLGSFCFLPVLEIYERYPLRFGKPVILFSTVLDHTYMGRLGIPFVDDPCIINVAVSRACDRFILVTDHSLFNKHSREVSDLIRYMEYNALDDNIIESEIVSIFDLLYREYSDKLISLQEGLLQASRFKSENIMWTYINILLNEPEFKSLEAATQIYLKNLKLSWDELIEDELRYVKTHWQMDYPIRKLPFVSD